MKKDRIQSVSFDKPIALMPLRDIVFFPGMVAPLFVGRQKSVSALDTVFKGTKIIMLATQKDAKVNDPEIDDIYNVGCLAEVLQILRLPDGTVKVLVEGIKRAKIKGFIDNKKFYEVTLEPFELNKKNDPKVTAIARTVSSLFEKYVKLNTSLSKETIQNLPEMKNFDNLADSVSTHLVTSVEDKQQILEATSLHKRMSILMEKLNQEIEVLRLEKRVRGRVQKQMEKSQRDYYLTEQMKAIQKELGNASDGEKTEGEEIKEKILNAGMPTEIKDKALKELSRLEQMPPMSSEGTVVRNYLDWLLDTPWKKRTRDKLDMKEAASILDADHYGLEKVKDRILEYLAVRKLVKKMKGPILCFVGPPGVGKTSLGKSIAKSMGRKFVRFSLGGLRDEAEIRGHRRTYIGALPGRIIQAMKKAGTKNPVIMLDEIDKVTSDFRGDPSSALLEALDPEQNTAFNDHYLEVDYDLSEVMFITTANVLHTIPRPLQDRMEILSISGYTDDEKKKIGSQFLLPKQLKAHGLSDKSVQIPSDIIGRIIRNYTREAGVRNLERSLGAIMRKVARDVAEKLDNKKIDSKKRSRKIVVDKKALVKYLGEIKYKDEEKEKINAIGVTTGLAFTELGGAIMKIETMILEGKTKFILTGKLGDVMKESAQAALSYIRVRAKDFGLAKGFHDKIDIHIHIPEGAIPKDGPSAGITLATSIVSALVNISAKHDVAMTGEITLRGQVLPIGGLKEKLLAAVRAGISTVLVPMENKRDLNEIPNTIVKKLKIIFVEHMDDVLLHALIKSPWKKKLSRPRINKPEHTERESVPIN